MIKARNADIEAKKELELKKLRHGFEKEKLELARQIERQNLRTEQHMRAIPSCRNSIIAKTK